MSDRSSTPPPASSLKASLKRWLPPVLADLARSALRNRITFAGDYGSWKEARAHSTGYDSSEILQRVLEATRKVIAGEGVFERDSVIFHQAEYRYPVLAGLLRAAAQNGGELFVIDFGGSLGSSYRQCRPFLRGLKKVEWIVVEQESFVRAGQEFLTTAELRFAFRAQDAAAARRPNVLLLSSVLQYLERPHAQLAELLELLPDYVIVDRTPFSREARDRLVVQRVPEQIYKASYPCWILSADRLLEGIGGRWEVVADFRSSMESEPIDAGARFRLGGFILARRP